MRNDDQLAGKRFERTLMWSEALEAPAVAETQREQLGAPLERLGARLRTLDPPLVITCGRGSSDHAATFAKYLIETRARRPVASHAPAISSLYSATSPRIAGALFLAISQSGRSPDLVLSARRARQAGALVVAVVNDEGSPLAEAAEIVVPMLAGPERGVAATKSYVASLLVITGLVAAWTGDAALSAALGDAPRSLRAAAAADWSPAIARCAAATSLFVLGRGLTLGIAQEAALKLKETCGLHAEAFSAAEVAHGPMALIGPGFPVLMLAPSDIAGAGFDQLTRDLVGRGAPVITTAAGSTGALVLPTAAVADPALAAIVMIQSFYGFAAALSLARGRDPDRPPHLSKVTETR